MRLDGAPIASCPEDAEGDSQCAGIHVGPALFDLPLGDEAEPTLTVLIPVGTYDLVKFQIHKPSQLRLLRFAQDDKDGPSVFGPARARRRSTSP